MENDKQAHENFT